MSIERLMLFRTAARVQRCHTVPPLHQQTVGEHSFGVCAILMHILPRAHLAVLGVLLRAAISHDVPEAVTGDIPSPMLHRYPALRDAIDKIEVDVNRDYDIAADITTEEHRLLKYADRMELAMFCIEEADSGNVKMLRLARRCLISMVEDKLTDITPEAMNLFDYVTMYLEQRWPKTGYGLCPEDNIFHGTPNL